nr:copia protein [Tanacetum cinerariifolium]
MDQDSAYMVAASKVPMLKPENDATLPKIQVLEGVTIVMPITSVADKAHRRLEMKAKSTLMMGISNEHQLKFNPIKDAKQLLEAIEKRFEMLDQTFDMLQKLVSQLELLGEKLSQEYVNRNLLRSLSPKWNTHVVVWRNKADLDTMRMDDLYNNLKVYEPKVKGMSSSNSNTQNMAFLSSTNSSTNRAVNTAQAVNNANEVFTASTQVNVAFSKNINNLSDDFICAFLASQPNSPQLTHEDLEQIHPDDMKEMDLRWKMVMLTMRARRQQAQGAQEGVCLWKHLLPQLLCHMMVLVDMIGGDQEEEGPNYALMAYTSSSSDSKIIDNCKKGLGYESNNAVLPPYTGNFMPLKPDLSYTSLDEFAVKPVVEHKSSKEETKTVRKNNDALIIEEWVSNDEEENVTQPKVNTVKGNNVNTARPKAVVNDVKGNLVNAVKASAYWTMKKLMKDMLLLKETPKEGKSQKKARTLNFKTINKLVKVNLVRDLPSKLFENDQNCVACQKGKQHKASCKSKTENSVSLPLHLLHMDLFGPTFVKSLMKKMYCLVVTDDYSRIENLADHKVKVIRCDNKTKFKNREMNLFCEIKGILRQFSAAKTPQQNGVAERRNRTLIEAARTMLADSKTSIVEENFHIRFSDNTPNIVGSRENWLFEIDALTRTMNYEPIVDEDPRKENECNNQKKEDNVNSTNNVNTVSATVNVAGTNEDNELPFDPNMPALEDVGTFNFSNEDGDDGEMVDMSNLETTIQAKRLVDEGHTQEEGIDYDEVFALVVRIKAIRPFLAYASIKDFMVYQMDVKSAFLYGKIEEEVYECQPPRFKDLEFPDRVYKVKKALYGLHQAPRAWYKTLSTYPLDNGFQREKIDKTLFIKRHKGYILLVQVYVDDIIFGSTRKELCNAFERLMHEKFQMSSMGELTFFLGLQVKQKNNGIFICQDKYVAEILKKFGFTKVKNASTPMETQKPLLKDEDGEEVDVNMYRLMIDSLMYLTYSRPDIMFAVCACARYQVIPKILHLHVVKRNFRRDLRLADEEGVDCFLNSTIFENLKLMGLQKLVSQLELLGENLSQEDINQKLLRCFSPEWNTHAIVWRNKADLDIISMDDFYNNLKKMMENASKLSKYGDEHLSTIPKTKSEELVKSSVKNLVPNPSASEDLSDIESECDVPFCDDFMTFSNSLFDADDNFSSSDDESFSDKDVPKEIYSNPLFDEEIIFIKIDPHHFNVESDLIESLLNQDSSIISSPKIDSLLEEFSGELAHINLIPLGINEADFDPDEEIRLDSNSLMEEIGLFLAPDDSIPPGIENDDYDSEGGILFLEELLSNDSPSLLENESFHFDVPSSPRPPAKPPDDGIYFEPNTGLLTAKVVDIYERYVPMSRLFPTQPTLCLVIDICFYFHSKMRTKFISYLIGALKLSSFLLKAR